MLRAKSVWGIERHLDSCVNFKIVSRKHTFPIRPAESTDLGEMRLGSAMNGGYQFSRQPCHDSTILRDTFDIAFEPDRGIGDVLDGPRWSRRQQRANPTPN